MPNLRKGEKQLGCIISEGAKVAANLGAGIRGQKLRDFIEQAIWHEVARLPKKQRALLEGMRGAKK